MKTYTVVFTPEAEDSLVSIYEYIASHGSPNTAARYTDAIVSYCEGMATFPHRGTLRSDVRPGLRLTNYKRRAVIAFEIDDATSQVAIIDVFYGGRDHHRLLGADNDEDEPAGDD